MKNEEILDGYKNTKVGVIPEDWSISKMGKLIDLISGQHINANDYNRDDKGIPYLTGPADFKKGFISTDKNTEMPKALCQKNDILITVKGSGTGSLIISDDTYCISRQLMAIRPINIAHKFIYNILIKNNKEFSDNAVGLIPGISRSDILDSYIALPPLPEQEKIADILTTWDVTIEKTEKLIELKEQRKKGLMQKLLTGKLRLPKYETGSMKDDKGYPADWQEKKLDDVMNIDLSPVPKPNTPYKSLGIRSHGKGTFQKFVEDSSKVAMDTLYEVKDNQMIVSITFAWEGAIAIVKKEDEGHLVSHRFPTYTIKEFELSADFLKYLILSTRMKYNLGLISPGGAGRNRVMSKKNFLKLKFILPPVEEQKAIAAVLSTADKELNVLRSKLEELKKQKKGMMQQLLTGKTRFAV